MKEALLYSPLARILLAPLVRAGYWRFRRTGHTPPPSYAGFRKLHCITRGALNRELSREIARATPLLDLDGATGVLGDRTALDAAVEGLKRDGIYVFPGRLDPALCSELHALATELPATLVPAPASGPREEQFSSTPRAPRYQFSETQLLASRAVRTLVADPSVFALAQRYLGAAPINDLITMWWSAPFGAASSAAAQLFHFDMDRIGFVKIFVYLTDVDVDSGPHVYVRGSHRSKPPAFFRDRRFTDREVEAAFPREDILELPGPVGTIIAADTSGLHKGKALARGHRLIFQLELANSLFGQSYERHRWHEASADDPLAAAIRRYPHALQRFGEAR